MPPAGKDIKRDLSKNQARDIVGTREVVNFWEKIKKNGVHQKRKENSDKIVQNGKNPEDLGQIL